MNWRYVTQAASPATIDETPPNPAMSRRGPAMAELSGARKRRNRESRRSEHESTAIVGECAPPLRRSVWPSTVERYLRANGPIPDVPAWA